MKIKETSSLDAQVYVAKLVRWANAGIVTQEEFLSNLFTTIAKSNEENWSETLAAVPAESLLVFKEYVSSYLENCCFRPSPAPFMHDLSNEAQNEEAKKQLEPRYRRFLKVVLKFHPVAE